MLKIRDDVNLKELERYYGFRYFDDCGQYQFIDRGTYIYINVWNRKITIYTGERK